MNNNVKIAKQLIGMARELVGRATFTDDLGEDSDNSNAKYNRQYEKIVRELFPDMVAKMIIMSGRMSEQMFPVHGTMGNGNIVLKYAVDEDHKSIFLMALVAEKHHIMPSDMRDIANLFKLLKKKVEDGYVLLADCNEQSVTFLSSFAKKNGYYCNIGESRNMMEMYGIPEKYYTRMCVVAKEKISEVDIGMGRTHRPGEDNKNDFSKERPNIEKMMDK